MEKHISFFTIVLMAFFLAVSCSTKTAEQKKEEKMEALRDEFEKKMDKIKDPALKAAIGENAMLYLFSHLDDFFSIEDKEYDGNVKYASNPFTIAGYYDNYNDFVENYKKSIIIMLSVFKEFKTTSLISNPFYSKVDLIALEGRDGKSYPIIEEDNIDTLSAIPQVYKRKNFGDIHVYFPQEDVDESEAFKEFSSAIGSGKFAVNTKTPKAIHSIKFGKNETNKTKTSDSVEVKLVSMKDNKLKLSITDKRKNDESNEYEVLGKESSGNYLSKSSSSYYVEEAKAYFKKKLDMLFKEDKYDQATAAKYDKMDEEFEAKGYPTVYEAAFEGLPDSIEVVLPDYNMAIVRQDTISAPIIYEDAPKSWENITAVIYSDEIEYADKDFEMSANNIQNEISTGDGDALMERDPYIKFKFPEKYLSNYFIDVFNRMGHVQDLKVYDNGFFGFFRSEISMAKTEKNQKDEDSFFSSGTDTTYYEFNTNSLKFDYEGLYPKQPRYVTGKIPIYLAVINKKEFNSAKLPMGFYLDGNRLAIDASMGQSEDLEVYIQAKDKKGRLLRRAQFGNSYRRVNDYYFYGTPANVIAYFKNGQDTVMYSFKKKLPEHDVKKNKEKAEQN